MIWLLLLLGIPVAAQVQSEPQYSLGSSKYEDEAPFVNQMLTNISDDIKPLQRMPDSTNLWKGKNIYTEKLGVFSRNTTGIIIPMYIYPSSPYSLASPYQRVVNLKKRFNDVPVIAILNPNSGPGSSIDNNYARAIRVLKGADITVVGYVYDSYGTKSSTQVFAEIASWRQYYPDIDGIFIDEMWNGVDASTITRYFNYTNASHNMGLFPVIVNPGTDINNVFVTSKTADLFMTKESSGYKSTSTAAGLFSGGYADTDKNVRISVSRAVMFNSNQIEHTTKYHGWVYFTERTSYSTLPVYLEQVFAFLSNQHSGGNEPQTAYMLNMSSITTSSGCVGAWQYGSRFTYTSTTNDTAFAVWTATTTASVNPVAVQVDDVCNPGTFCRYAIGGIVRARALSSGAGLNLGLTTSSTGCYADYVAAGSGNGASLNSSTTDNWLWVWMR